jgi:hypothetical protein
MNIKPYSYKPKDSFPLKLLKVCAVLFTIAAMGFFVYTVYDALNADSDKIRDSLKETDKMIQDYQKQYGK